MRAPTIRSGLFIRTPYRNYPLYAGVFQKKTVQISLWPNEVSSQAKASNPGQLRSQNIYICDVKISSEHINLFLEKCKAANCAGVFYSLPFQNEFEFLLEDLNGSKKDVYHPFIFFPFDDKTLQKIQLNPNYKNEEAVEFLQRTETNNGYWTNSSLELIESTTKQEYEENFKKYQTAIQSGKCVKAILSTIIKHSIPQKFNAGEYILKLRQIYPQAFIYLFSSPAAGTWIGATPETLVKYERGIVSTMSLAGTRKLNDAGGFGKKEEREQNIVTEFIDVIFQKRFSKVQLNQTEKLTYGEIEHLITRVEGVADQNFSGTDLLELAAEMHPTPAVGGYPQKPAIDLISKTEGHSRLYYSGYLGLLNDHSAHLAVNLRCMSLGANDVYVYAGGGITADSEPDSEWEETRLKARALLKFL